MLFWGIEKLLFEINNLFLKKDCYNLKTSYSNTVNRFGPNLLTQVCILAIKLSADTKNLGSHLSTAEILAIKMY